MLLNVLDFGPNVAVGTQLALDAANDGDRVYLPGLGFAYEAPVGGWKIRKSLEVFGDGIALPGDASGTTIVPSNAGENVFVIEPASSSNERRTIFLHGFKISQQSDTLQPGSGIRCSLAANQGILFIRLERIGVLNTTETGMLFEVVGLGDHRIALISASGCYASFCGKLCMSFQGVRQVRIAQCGGGGGHDGALRAEDSAISVYTTGFDNNKNLEQGSWLLKSCSIAMVESSHFENYSSYWEGDTPVDIPNPDYRLACEFQLCRGAAVISSSVFTNRFLDGVAESLRDSRAIISNDGPVTIYPCNITRTKPVLVDIDPLAIGVTVMPQFNNQNVKGFIAPATGEIRLPTQNRSAFGYPMVRGVDAGGANDTRSGMVVPSGVQGDPVGKEGMLFYDTNNHRLRAFLNNSWRTVTLEPPP